MPEQPDMFFRVYHKDSNVNDSTSSFSLIKQDQQSIEYFLDQLVDNISQEWRKEFSKNGSLNEVEGRYYATIYNMQITFYNKDLKMFLKLLYYHLYNKERFANIHEEWKNYCNNEKTSCPMIHGFEFYNLKLEHIHLSNISFSLCSFINSNFTGVDFTNAELYNADFSKAKLSEVDFSNAILGEDDFSNAELFKANFSNTNSYDANFSSAELDDANFSNTNSYNDNFSGARLSEADFSNAKLYDANFSKAELGDADFSNAKLSEADFSNAKLYDANFSNAELDDADFSKAVLDEADFSNARLFKANFSNAELDDADFSKAVFTYVNFVEARCRKTIFDGTDFLTSTTNEMFFEPPQEKDVSDIQLTNVNLNNINITEELKSVFEYNRRKTKWEEYYNYNEAPDSTTVLIKLFNRLRHPIKTAIKLFWWSTDYGYSTLRILLTLSIITLLFSGIYLIGYYTNNPLIELTPIIDTINCDIDSQNIIKNKLTLNHIQIVLRSIYFSIVTMTTLGFGDITVNPASYFGHIIVSIQVILGYIGLGALITRIGTLFNSTGPTVTPNEYKQNN